MFRVVCCLVELLEPFLLPMSDQLLVHRCLDGVKEPRAWSRAHCFQQRVQCLMRNQRAINGSHSERDIINVIYLGVCYASMIERVVLTPWFEQRTQAGRHGPLQLPLLFLLVPLLLLVNEQQNLIRNEQNKLL